MEDHKLKELITDSLKKLEGTAFQDSKLLTEMNNALSWLLTLTVVLFVYYSKFFSNIELSCPKLIIVQASKYLFVISLVLFLTHKISLILYEKIKSLYQESLRTHALELKYDIRHVQKRISTDQDLSFFTFINRFRNGELVPHPNLDNRPKQFQKYEQTISNLGRILKFTFWTEIVIFVLFMIGACSLIF